MVWTIPKLIFETTKHSKRKYDLRKLGGCTTILQWRCSTTKSLLALERAKLFIKRCRAHKIFINLTIKFLRRLTNTVLIYKTLNLKFTYCDMKYTHKSSTPDPCDSRKLGIYTKSNECISLYKCFFWSLVLHNHGNITVKANLHSTIPQKNFTRNQITRNFLVHCNVVYWDRLFST